MKGMKGAKKDKKRKSFHLEKRRLQDDWCKELPLEMLPTQDKTQK